MRHGRTVLLVVALVVVLALYLYLAFRDNSTVDDSVARAPGFSLPDATGLDVVLSDIQADLRLVHFWASWSPYSAEDLTSLSRLQTEFGDKVAVIALNRDTNPQEGKDYLAGLGVGDRVIFAYDREDTYFKEVGGYNMPETLFVAPDDTILLHVRGPMPYETAREHIVRLLP
jgi:thiol-disulfide isomerase/thioredoxin